MPAADGRPDPDHLLLQARAEEARERRGALKVFLGYAAGVGKTYAMLQAARQRRDEGVDVVLAYVETHGRAETEALTEGLETLPRREVEYHGTRLSDLDLDAALARRPRLAIVDELAHTNAPGSRHAKRAQDVLELLAAGIDVYTTLNVQHLESTKDVVAQITGIVVRETVPDRLIDEADEIELVDLPPNELLRRLAEGKVYVAEQAERARERFFREGNLTGLRELALRRAARRVDEQMRAYMQMRSIAGPWPAAERLLVCVSASPASERLIRAARRLADDVRAEWFALHVETSGQGSGSEGDRDRLARNLRLAESLGAKVATRTADAIAPSVVAFARDHNVTNIVLGKPAHPRWRELLRGSLVDRIARLSGPIDLTLIGGEGIPEAHRSEPARRAPAWRDYLASLGLVAAATAVGWPIHLAIEPINLAILYLAAVVVAALKLGRGPAVLASFLGVAAFDFCFVPPKLTFVVSDTQYLLTFGGLLVVGLVISTLAAQVRDQVEAGRLREEQTASLYSLSRDLAVAADREAVARAVLEHLGRTFGLSGAVLRPGDTPDALVPLGPATAPPLTEAQQAVASWTFRNGLPAGAGTETLASAGIRCLPLVAARGPVGVLALSPEHAGAGADPARGRLVEAFASQAALALERADLAEEARHVALLRETEKLHSALLNSISHELRTPLASISGVLSTLREPRAAGLAEPERTELLEVAWEQTDRLNRLVGNLLDMTRLEAGAFRVARDPCDLQDLVGSVLEGLEEQLARREVRISLAAELPLIAADFVLLAQALTNVLDNAAKYSPPESPIDIEARPADGGVEVRVSDRGAGIPAGERERVFEKFHRAGNVRGVPGTGLGLSITRGIVEAHGGTARAEERKGGGATVILWLPNGAPASRKEGGGA